MVLNRAIWMKKTFGRLEWSFCRIMDNFGNQTQLRLLYTALVQGTASYRYQFCRKHHRGLWTVICSLSALVVCAWSRARFSALLRFLLMIIHPRTSQPSCRRMKRISIAKTHRPMIGMGLGYQTAQKISTTMSPKRKGMAIAVADIRRNWSWTWNEVTRTPIIDNSLTAAHIDVYDDWRRIIWESAVYEFDKASLKAIRTATACLGTILDLLPTNVPCTGKRGKNSF